MSNIEKRAKEANEIINDYNDLTASELMQLIDKAGVPATDDLIAALTTAYLAGFGAGYSQQMREVLRA